MLAVDSNEASIGPQILFSYLWIACYKHFYQAEILNKINAVSNHNIPAIRILCS